MIRKRLALILVIFLFSVIYVNFISAQETGNGNQTGNETNYTAEYDPEILSAFENQTWLPVVVRLVDNSGINVTGTKEERRALSKQTREWFEPVVNEVLGTLSKDEFEIHNKLFNGFAGEITKEGFDVLLNNINVREIIWDNVPLGEVIIKQNNSESENVLEAEEEQKSKIVINDSPVPNEINELERNTFTFLWVVIILIILTVIVYLIIKSKKK